MCYSIRAEESIRGKGPVVLEVKPKLATVIWLPKKDLYRWTAYSGKIHRRLGRLCGGHDT